MAQVSDRRQRSLPDEQQIVITGTIGNIFTSGLQDTTTMLQEGLLFLFVFPHFVERVLSLAHVDTLDLGDALAVEVTRQGFFASLGTGGRTPQAGTDAEQEQDLRN